MWCRCYIPEYLFGIPLCNRRCDINQYHSPVTSCKRPWLPYDVIRGGLPTIVFALRGCWLDKTMVGVPH